MWLRIFPLTGIVSGVHQRLYRRISRWVLRKAGVKIEGLPLWISPRVFFDVSFPGSISIGDRTVISHYVRVLTHDFSLDRAAERLQVVPDEGLEYYKANEVRIGSHVFIGLGATLMPGISVGNGAIIATNALVTRDVPEDTLVAGSPARVISTTREYFDKRNNEFELRRRRR